MPIWLRAAPNPIFVSATRASQTWVTRRRRRRGRLKIPTTRSAHSLATLSPKREAMAFDFEPKTLDLSPMFNPDPETLNSNKAKRSQDTPRPMLLDSQVQSHCHEKHEKVFALSDQSRRGRDATELATQLSHLHRFPGAGVSRNIRAVITTRCFSKAQLKQSPHETWRTGPTSGWFGRGSAQGPITVAAQAVITRIPLAERKRTCTAPTVLSQMLCPIRDFESVGSLRSRISSHPADRTRHFHPSGSSADSFVLLLATAEGVHLPDADDGDALPHNQTRCFSSKARHCCLMWHHIRRANVPTIGRSSAQGAVIAAAPAVQSSPSKNVHGIDCNFANDCHDYRDSKKVGFLLSRSHSQLP